MPENVVIDTSGNTITATNKDGDEYEIHVVEKKDMKKGKVKVKRSEKKKGQKAKPLDDDKPIEWVVEYTPKDPGSTKWNVPNVLEIEVYCPDLKDGAHKTEKPYLRLASKNPDMDVKIELKDHDAQAAKIGDLKKLLGEHEKSK